MADPGEAVKIVHVVRSRLRGYALLILLLAMPPALAQTEGDLSPIDDRQWSPTYAAHLLERAGFDATPAEVQRLSALSPREALRSLMPASGAAQSVVTSSVLPPFDASDIFDEGLDPFPPSRPAATDLAKRTGEALGVKVKPSGNRRLQPVADRFFYWLRASKLETERLAIWWAERMLNSPTPLQEKAALFWHGHFASSEDKVRDVRKLQMQLALFQSHGLGSFRDLLIGAAQDPAMLVFLDAGVNVKDKPNENFAREIMELFSLGVGHYTEADIREAARAFTGWHVNGLRFAIDPQRHDAGVKTVLGHSGRFGGVEVIDILLAQPAASEYIATKLYRYFVREQVSPELREALGRLLRDKQWHVGEFLQALLLSNDFYAAASVGSRIKPPVELVVSTYRKLGLTRIPGQPDFNETTAALGQKLFYPPTVAGWAQGRAWITPGLLIERGNFIQDLLFAHITAVASDRYPGTATGSEIAAVHERARAGADISTATKPVGRSGVRATAGAPAAPGQEEGAGMAMSAQSNLNADRDEDFNTRWASYRGWQMAVERVKPIVRDHARIRLASLVQQQQCRTVSDAVTALASRFLSVPITLAQQRLLAEFLARELGSTQLAEVSTTLEEPLRMTLHAMLSLAEFQLH